MPELDNESDLFQSQVLKSSGIFISLQLWPQELLGVLDGLDIDNDADLFQSQGSETSLKKFGPFHNLYNFGLRNRWLCWMPGQ